MSKNIRCTVDDNCCWLKFGEAIEDGGFLSIHHWETFEQTKLDRNRMEIHGFMFFEGDLYFGEPMKKVNKLTHTTWKVDGGSLPCIGLSWPRDR